MMYYIQRNGNGQRETVDHFETKSEAEEMLNEYILGDNTARYYISKRPCAGYWE